MKPEILCHPNIPKPLHGISPRTIKGKEWWDITRQEVYKSTDYHCVACGVHKSEAKKYSWLEAHEFWDINYQTGVCTIKTIEPLCHYCHMFIHSGRLSHTIDKDKPRKEIMEILEHGFKILSKTDLKCFYGTYELAKMLKVRTLGVKCYESNMNKNLKWNDFVLIFEGKVYKSKFKDYSEWKRYYTSGGRNGL